MYVLLYEKLEVSGKEYKIFSLVLLGPLAVKVFQKAASEAAIRL